MEKAGRLRNGLKKATRYRHRRACVSARVRQITGAGERDVASRVVHGEIEIGACVARAGLCCDASSIICCLFRQNKQGPIGPETEEHGGGGVRDVT